MPRQKLTWKDKRSDLKSGINSNTNGIRILNNVILVGNSIEKALPYFVKVSKTINFDRFIIRPSFS